MAKTKLIFHCNACGNQLSKWAGQCPECQAWNTVEEFRQPLGAVKRSGGYSGAGRREVTRLSSVTTADTPRLASGLDEFDRVLGGGLVPGSVVLLGGEPGIGKSTLLLQAMAQMAASQHCLYVTGEESLQQIAMRAKRLGVDADALQCLTETCVETVLETAQANMPAVLIVDSIQTLYSENTDSAPGSVSQVRESAAQLVRFAKSGQCAIILVGHVTKDGSLAGPRVLEHMVDAVLYFESDGGSRYRIVRSFKNRFGTINELGVFAMTGTGLKQVSNPSAIFLSGRAEDTAGSMVTVTREGTRPLLLELQALVDDSQLANPRRVAIGMDHNRLAMLLAVLHRHGGVKLADQDVYLNVVGGLRIAETGSDLPALLAVLSSFRNHIAIAGTVAFGEVGLSGEIRPVHNGEERLKEAVSHGFKRAIIPQANAPRANSAPWAKGFQVVAVRTLAEAITAAFD